MKFVFIGLAILLGLPAAWSLLTLTWPDAGIHAQAKQVLATPPAKVPDDENLYHGLIGFDAPAGEADFVAYGAQRVREINRRLAANASDEIDFKDLFTGELDTAELRSLCIPEQTSCLDEWRAQGDAIDALADQYRTHLERFARLRKLPGYAMTMTPDHRAPLARVSDAMAVYNLRLNALGLDCATGDTAETLARILAEIDFVRRALRLSAQLIDKIVAAELLRRTLYVYADCVDALPGDRAAQASIPLLTPAELSLREPYMTMFREAARLLVVLSKSPQLVDMEQELPEWALRALLKPNRSTNLAFATYAALTRVSELPAGSIQNETRVALAGLRAPWQEYVINPVGAILHEVSAPATATYAYRLHDVSGLIALVNAKLALRAQGASAAGIPATLQDSQWRNPYDQAPLAWDAEAQELFFSSPYEESRANRLRHAP